MNIWQIDYKKLATLGGYKTPASANASWLMVKKKLLNATGTIGNTQKASPEEGANEALADDEGTPSIETPKKQRGGRKSKALLTGGTPTSKKRSQGSGNEAGRPPAKKAKNSLINKDDEADGFDDGKFGEDGIVIKSEQSGDNDDVGAEGHKEDTGVFAEVGGEFLQQLEMINA